MKRLNSETGKPFIQGYVREDGMVFKQYDKRKNANEYFYEQWTKPELLKSFQKSSNKSAWAHLLTPKGRAKLLLYSAKKRSKGKVTITWEWIAKKIQNGKCELTGIEFNLKRPKETKTNPYSPSLDRIDNKNRDYTPENTRVVLTAVNLALGEFGMDVMKPILEKMLNEGN